MVSLMILILDLASNKMSAKEQYSHLKVSLFTDVKNKQIG